MSNLTRKSIMASMVAGLGLMLSVNASAQESSLETAMAKMILAQSQQVAQNLSAQIQQSITQDVENFSIDSALTWFSVDSQSVEKQEKTAVAKSPNHNDNTSEDE